MLILLACGGQLTPEQREKARKAIEEGKIRRVTPAQLTEVALALGKKIAYEVGGGDPFFSNTAFIDSLANAHGVVIYAMREKTINMQPQEVQILEAYQAQADVNTTVDNIQDLAGDTLLYTMPVANERPDGTRAFSHAIAIKIPLKKVVLSVTN